jgi:hypothetical protein
VIRSNRTASPIGGPIARPNTRKTIYSGLSALGGAAALAAIAETGLRRSVAYSCRAQRGLATLAPTKRGKSKVLVQHSLNIIRNLCLGASVVSLSAQTVTINGQLFAEDTQRPLQRVVITVVELTKPPVLTTATTGPDGRFSIEAKSGAHYRLCSAATGRYAESCQFSKPVIVKADSNLPSIQMPAPTGIRIRVRVADPDGLLRSPDGKFVAPDPLLLHVFAKEEVTSTHIPLQLVPSPSISGAFEAAVVIPASMRWDVAMSSVKAKLIGSDGNPYQSKAAIPRPASSSDDEFLAEFTLRVK